MIAFCGPMPMPSLSPYTRGNLLSSEFSRFKLGSIPVHTGKPSSNRGKWNSHKGLSPYTRGNRSSRAREMAFRRSIPVHTGKPAYIDREGVHARVYPRTHGETSSYKYVARATQGLSPYTRGNLKRKHKDLLLKRSIPVHTGKP